MNTITIDNVANQLQAYLKNDMDLNALVDWSEEAMMEGVFDSENAEIIRDVIARLGISDVCEFGLTWHDCEHMLHQLGYQTHIEIVKQ